MHSSRMRTARSGSHLLGGCLPQCMLGYTPRAWDPQVLTWTPPSGIGLDTPLGLGLHPPSQTPNLPPGCGLDISLAILPTSPWVWASAPLPSPHYPQPDPNLPLSEGLDPLWLDPQSPPGCGPRHPLGVGLDSPQPDPSTSPPRV